MARSSRSSRNRVHPVRRSRTYEVTPGPVVRVAPAAGTIRATRRAQNSIAATSAHRVRTGPAVAMSSPASGAPVIMPIRRAPSTALVARSAVTLAALHRPGQQELLRGVGGAARSAHHEHQADQDRQRQRVPGVQQRNQGQGRGAQHVGTGTDGPRGQPVHDRAA